MRSRPGLRPIGLAVLLALAAALSGCSLIAPQPPDNVVSSVNRAVDAIRATHGVAEVSWSISRRDRALVPLNELWTASIEVRTEADAAGFEPLAEAVEGHVESARDVVQATAILRLPADGTGVEVVLAVPSAAAGGIAGATVDLRHIEHATMVHLQSYESFATLTVDSTDALVQAIADVRALPDFGHGALTAVTVVAVAPSGTTSRLTASAQSPSVDLVPVLSQLAGRTDIEALTFNGQRGAERPGEASTWRPGLRVEASSPRSARAITTLLTGIDVPAGGSDVPRASFTVDTRVDGNAFTQDGYLGLPLGSPAPADYVDAPASDAAAAEPGDGTSDGLPANAGSAGGIEASSELRLLDASAAAGQLQSDQQRVTAFLDAAGDAAGIRGVASVAVTACDLGVGEHVQGAVLLPIFEITDSPGAPFDAIIAAWKLQGFVATDRAMGTDFYSQQNPSDSLRDLTIRGTSDGLSLSAESVCVVVD